MDDREVLDMGPLGVRVEIQHTGDDRLEFLVTGTPRGLLTGQHMHIGLTERLEVRSGAMKVVMHGATHELREGEMIEIPPSTPHRQLGAGSDPGVVHVTVTPPGRTLEMLRYFQSLGAEGNINRLGFPKPLAGAKLVREFAAEGHATRPPLPVQRAGASLLLGAHSLLSSGGELARKAAENAYREYVFVDEWDVAAPQEAVFNALADARTYPEWWKQVYIDVQADGPPAVGMESRQHFKGRLPYHLNTRSVVVEMDAPRLIRGDVDGDLRGTGVWTLTPNDDGGTHVRFDWRVYADRKLLRVLTPLLRPVLRWNHNWSIARAIEGLEPYAKAHAAA